MLREDLFGCALVIIIQQVEPVSVGRVVVRGERQHLAEDGVRLVDLRLLQERHAEIGARVGVGWVQPQRLAQVPLRLIQSTKSNEQRPVEPQRQRIVRVLLNRLAQARRSAVPAQLKRQHLAELFVHAGVVGPFADRLLQHRLGAAHVAERRE